MRLPKQIVVSNKVTIMNSDLSHLRSLWFTVIFYTHMPVQFTICHYFIVFLKVHYDNILRIIFICMCNDGVINY